ncbi:ABC transporter substrate-binding protein [Aquicoccus sp. SCR17]|nr:ABC transporter substrate-binding protein [Carideicomes alvinocaridis]
MNVCTDQLAMMLADPGQLLSVSAFATDPRMSSMPEEAAAYRVNHGRAEEIYTMRPDLVIAGAFSNRQSVDMLRRLGVEVVVVEPAYGLDDVPDRIREVGRALGQGDRAGRMARAFEERLARLRSGRDDGLRAALYYANGYTSGGKTLAGQILQAAGFRNVAEEVGLSNGGTMPLEVLAMTAPDAIITGRPHAGAARAEAILDHPVVRALRAESADMVVPDTDWVCGTPHALDAVAALREARLALAAR